MPKFPIYPKVTTRNFRRWNEEMFCKYNNERVYNHPNLIIRFVESMRVKQLLNHLLPIKDSDKILAAGSGEGHIERYLKNGEVSLIDISKEAIRRAKDNLGVQNNYKFIVGDLEKIPVRDNYFDKVECSEVIEHVMSPKKMLKELCRVLKPNGTMVITFPNEPLINYLKGALIKLHLFNYFFPNIPRDMTEEWHLRAYDLRSFKKDSESRWRLVDIKGIPFSFFPVRYLVVCRKK
ncbi:hypothetical protein A2634_04745 [Candidatus Amesbacteria bacterium RIFCSPHIGHO2_01_FULL_48_32]|uniref:Methyltransferase domain-containing protein n=1 Tax=Candidatus Amesbacteria bacterium RIFCSPLOWO2_01_FULL_48_25 TaxID=1797259 RepID=A0A1F4ZB65_9BACT|nr:MAG: hypothetical protein A2634_04745 [Candidatus Amesbacteria bacterium RIFCSPHIGHO2_01_FULL_48_32]OGD03455.1 MAG: hypothetical protein A2989_02395 [Candidatus Amesbacteria bacterium RIFCSPLOWO2_01_FULL_48_25]